MKNKTAPFQLLIDSAAALAAAARLRSHLPPYSSALPVTVDERDDGESGLAHKSEEAGARQP